MQIPRTKRLSHQLVGIVALRRMLTAIEISAHEAHLFSASLRQLTCALIGSYQLRKISPGDRYAIIGIVRLQTVWVFVYIGAR